MSVCCLYSCVDGRQRRFKYTRCGSGNHGIDSITYALNDAYCLSIISFSDTKNFDSKLSYAFMEPVTSRFSRNFLGLVQELFIYLDTLLRNTHLWVHPPDISSKFPTVVTAVENIQCDRRKAYAAIRFADESIPGFVFNDKRCILGKYSDSCPIDNIYHETDWFMLLIISYTESKMIWYDIYFPKLEQLFNSAMKLECR